MRVKIKFLLLAALTVMMQGCAVLAYSPFSKPSAPQGVDAGKGGGPIYLRMGAKSSIELEQPEWSSPAGRVRTIRIAMSCAYYRVTIAGMTMKQQDRCWMWPSGA